MTDIKSKIDDNIQLDILDKNYNVKRMLEEALTYGYHASKDELKGISSSGYMTRFFEKYNIK